MLDLSDLNVRALREMAERIVTDIEREKAVFAQGGWIKQDDVAATGMHAVMLQKKIAGLEAALVHIQETNRKLTGKVEKKEKAA